MKSAKPSKPRIAGVVLAGGKSSRFGSDKSQLVIHGKPIVEAQLEKLASAGCEPLLIVGRSPSVGEIGFSRAPRGGARPTVLTDIFPNLGPIGGLHVALKTIEPCHNAVFLLACDMPLISTKTIRRIVALFRRLAVSPSRPLDCLVPIHDGKLEPLCAVYSRAILPAVESRIAARKLAMHDLAKSLTTQFLDVTTLANWEREFYNVNTQADYKRIKRKS